MATLKPEDAKEAEKIFISLLQGKNLGNASKSRRFLPPSNNPEKKTYRGRGASTLVMVVLGGIAVEEPHGNSGWTVGLVFIGGCSMLGLWVLMAWLLGA